MANIPEDVRKELEESGAVFDKDGNLVEDNFFKSIMKSVETENDEEESDENETDQDDQEEQSEDTSEQEDASDQSDADEEDDKDEEDQEEKVEKEVTKAKPKLTDKKETLNKKKLTPASDKKENNTEVEDLKRKIEELRTMLETNNTSKLDKSQTKPQSDNNFQENELFRKLEQEREEFQKFRMQQLASQLQNEVDKRFSDAGVTFKEVIASEEWSDFLNTRKYGNPVKNYYQQAIANNDWDSMVGFFDEFKVLYLNDDKVTEEKPKLDDLVVPEKSKTVKKPPRKTKFDFTTDDYIEMANKLERGRISIVEFNKFEEAYDKADKQGRVKSN